MRCSTLLETQHVGHRRCFFMDCHSTSRTGQLDLSAILPYPSPLQVQASEVYRFVNIAGWLKQSIVTAAFTESATSRLLGAKLIVRSMHAMFNDAFFEFRRQPGPVEGLTVAEPPAQMCVFVQDRIGDGKYNLQEPLESVLPLQVSDGNVRSWLRGVLAQAHLDPGWHTDVALNVRSSKYGFS